MKKSQGTLLNFIKRNAVYLILALCIIAVGIATTFMLISKNARLNSELNDTPIIDTPVEKPDDPIIDDPVIEKPDDPIIDDPVIEKPDDPINPDVPVVEPITYILPVAEATSIEDYSNTMVFNSTLGRFTAHLAIDFFAPEGTSVYAIADGTVSAVDSSLLHGITVTIDHGNGLVSIYNSLADGESVTVGATVKKGDVIGQVSVTNRQEYKSGAHLHFEMKENGTLIDPAKYLVFEEK